MKATIQSVEIKEIGPDYRSRREHRGADGSFKGVSYDGVNEISLKIRLSGDLRESAEFLKSIKVGAELKRFDLESKASKAKPATRRYVFD